MAPGGLGSIGETSERVLKTPSEEQSATLGLFATDTQFITLQVHFNDTLKDHYCTSSEQSEHFEPKKKKTLQHIFHCDEYLTAAPPSPPTSSYRRRKPLSVLPTATS